MKIYKVGILGFGFIGKVHAYGYQNIPLYYDQQDFRTSISKVCTSRLETARKAANLLGSAQPVLDYREITEDPEIDIVNICTPNHLHHAALLSAIKHQKHIYCDKPLTATWEEAKEIKEALKEYRGISQMTLQNRFFPAVMRAKQLIEEGCIGRVLEFRASYLHSGSSDPKAPLKWKLSAEAGGGVVADLGSHVIDLMHYLLGDFSELSAATSIAYAQRPSADDPGKMLNVEAEDNMLLTVRLPNGAFGQISASKIATGTEDEVAFEIHGNKGAVRLMPMQWHRLHYYNCAAPTAPQGGLRGWTAIDCGHRYDKPGGFPTPKAVIGWMRGHMHCLYNFLANVHAGKQSEPDLKHGVYIQYLLEKVKESAKTKSWLSLQASK
ncbi:MAG: Gfo/Idh/MocA family oxidoreductase [Oligosphaeraceae bacterium]|nr:Gfo/Idh/MocA family oxidoreductase [Oligosphaeraceae bacterium]